nr:MAG TPA: hypothetical protein [Caudoviricetes sp.]
MATNFNIEITSPEGATFNTENKHVGGKIFAVPKLQAKDVAPSASAQSVAPDEGYAGLSAVNVAAVTAAVDPNIVPDNIKQGVTILGVTGTLSGGGGDVPSLYAPTIAINNSGVLTVTDTRNGAFAYKYYLVINNTQGTEITNKTIDLTTIFADYAVGTYNVKVRVVGQPDNELQAADSNVVTYGVYSISYNLSHVTASVAPTKIQAYTQVEITVAADTDYFLPADITIGNASIVEYDITTGKLVIGKATGEVSVTIEGTQDQPIVAKGKIITIEGKQYRVLKVAGNVVEVLAMYDASTSQQFNDTSKTVVFTGGATGQQYQGSDLDTYLNETFFATLSATMQAAIVPKAINQDMWDYSSSEPSSGTYYHQTYGTSNRYYFDNQNGTAYGTAEVGSRNVYALSVKDVIDYLGVSAGGDFADTDIWQMFWNDNSSHSGQYPWLRSAYRRGSDSAFYVSGSSGNLSDGIYYGRNRARPAFQIDLSKVEWSAE